MQQNSGFLQLVNASHFDSNLPEDGEECRDLFLLNCSNTAAASRLTTGCLTVFADDVVGARHSFAATPSILPNTNAASDIEVVLEDKKRSHKKKPKRVTADFTAGHAIVVAMDEGPEVTTRSGRLSKRPQTAFTIDGGFLE
jgi:hypothetical protein